ncbi:MAG: beta-propeller domain-containing protein [Firmicutes bacterium]|nr:beta-propeller domain-containing protein [Bacillota bacterium]
MSDIDNITYTHTGTIPGFSVSLIKFGDKLLGIGEGDSSADLKIEAYKQTEVNEEQKVVSAGTYTLKNCSFSAEFKARFINAEHGLVGLQVIDYNNSFVTSNPSQPSSEAKYLLLRYDYEKEKFEAVSYRSFDTGIDWARAFYLDNAVYVFGNSGFNVIDLSE